MNAILQIITNSLIAGAIYTLVAIGFNLIAGATRFFNLSHGIAATVGGYAFYTLARLWGLNPIAAAVIAIAFAGLFGFLSDKLVFGVLRWKKASNTVLLVASLGIFTAVQAVIAIIFSNQFQTLTDAVDGQTSFNVAGAMLSSTQLLIIILSALTSIGLILLLNKTIFGRAVKAVSDDEEVARVVGINSGRIIGRLFFIGYAIAGLAGILVGLDTGIQPTMGMGLLLKGVIAAIIGGVGSIHGAILGAFLLGFVENFGIWQIPGEWKDAVAFLLLIVFLIFRPSGLIKK